MYRNALISQLHPQYSEITVVARSLGCQDLKHGVEVTGHTQTNVFSFLVMVETFDVRLDMNNWIDMTVLDRNTQEVGLFTLDPGEA